jgi:addiction module HigA family antidote
VTADTALRLGRYFGTGPEFWLNLQIMFDLAQAADAAPDIAEIEPLAA